MVHPSPFYHASDFKIRRPSRQALARHTRRQFCGVPILALYASSDGPSLYEYGRYTYQFEIDPAAICAEISELSYELMREDLHYRAGLFDGARAAGAAALLSSSETDTSAAILDLTCIQNWRSVDI